MVLISPGYPGCAWLGRQTWCRLHSFVISVLSVYHGVYLAADVQMDDSTTPWTCLDSKRFSRVITEILMFLLIF